MIEAATARCVFSDAEYRAWLDFLLPGVGEGLVVVMVWVGIDESGTHGSTCVCVASCLGTASQWTKFRAAWEPVAAKYEDGYHATKASPEDNALLAELTLKYLAGGWAVRAAFQDFRELVPQDIRSRRGSEYTNAIRIIVQRIGMFCDEKDIDWVAYVIEDGHKNASRVKQSFNEIKALPVNHPHRWHVYSDTWVGKENAMTHPADLVSHEFFSAFERNESELLKALRTKFACHHYSRDALHEAMEATRESEKQIRWAKVRATKRRKPRS